MLIFSNLFGDGGGCTNPSGFKKLSTDTFYLSNSTYNIGLNRIIYVDTTSGEFSIKLDAIPEPGDVVIVVDIGGNLALEPVRFLNLGKLAKLPNNEYFLNIPNSIYKFYFVSEDYGWVFEHAIINKLNPDQTIPEIIVAWSEVLNKPTTIAGYGITDLYTKSQVDAMLVSSRIFANILNKPTTISGYGITDAYTKSQQYRKNESYPKSSVYSKNENYNKTEIDSLLSNSGYTYSWSSITGKPTDINGFGITDIIKTGNAYELTTSQTAAPSDIIYVNVDGVTITLPVNPQQADRVMIFIGDTLTTQVVGNGKLINGSINNFVLDVKNNGVELYYLNVGNSGFGNWYVH